MMTAKEAARACQVAQSEKELRDAFGQFILYLHEWCKSRAADVHTAYVYPGDGFLNILICTRGEDYRFDLDDPVTELDLDLTRQFGWLVAEVMQVPEGSREGHIALEKAIIVYGDGSSARATSHP
jgi:hypothetical protein